MFRLVALSGLALVLGACGSAQSVQVQVLYQSERCPATQPGVQVISDADAWTEWQRERDTQFFFSPNDSDDAATVPDFDGVTVMVISMGQKPTPGYSIEISGGEVADGSLTITSVWQEPAEGTILPQVLTSPCIEVSVPSAQYNAVRIEDQFGETIIDHEI